MKWVLCLAFCFGAVWGKHEMYDGHTLYEVSVTNREQMQVLKQLETDIGADFWSEALPGRPGTVLIAKDQKQKFQNDLETAGVQFKVQVENIKEIMDLEDKLLKEASTKKTNRTSGRVTPLELDRVYTYEEVDEYLEEVARAYPDIVTLVLGGYSFEGRPIKYLKISTSNFEDNRKPVVFIESLIHAREWIALSTTLFAIEKLVLDVTESDLLQTIDWIILPVVNPDGYVWTHENTRLWRKNRATGYFVNDLCVGVDLNRNFAVNWAEWSSNLVCSDVFHGREAFSEPETAIIRDIMLEHNTRLELFLDIHSFGSMILYGFGSGILPPNALWLHMVGVNMATEIDKNKMDYNDDYIVGNVAAVLYQASGSAQDYAQLIGTPYSYTFELPGYRLGGNTGLGFFVDPEFFRQAGFETWEGIKVGARYVRNNYRIRHNLV